MIYAFIIAVLFMTIVWAFLTGGRCFGRRIYSRFAGGILVTLEDYDGRIFKTLAYKAPSGRLVAPVYFFTNVGRCVLEDDGTVKNHYIVSWTKS